MTGFSSVRIPSTSIYLPAHSHYTAHCRTLTTEMQNNNTVFPEADVCDIRPRSNMPEPKWVMLYGFCGKFHTLSSNAKILKIG